MVKQALGHSKLETTMVYTHVTNPILGEKVNNAFLPSYERNIGKETPRYTDPLAIVMQRLARGEINHETFIKLRNTIRQENTPANQYIS